MEEPIQSPRVPKISLSSSSGIQTQLPQSPRGPMEFLSRSWSASALGVSKALHAPPPNPPPCIMLQPPPNKQSVTATPTATTISSFSIPEDIAAETEELSASSAAAAQFSFASSATSQLVLERIMSQSEVSPLTSGRLSHSSGPLNGGGSLTETDSPPVSPSEEFEDVVKYFRCNNSIQPLFTNNRASAGGNGSNTPGGRPKTVGRWLKERKEKKKEESRAHNAQLHAAVSVAAVAAAVAAIAAATSASSSSRRNEKSAKTDTAVASAATLVAAQCVEAAETMGAEREHLASVISSAVNVRSQDDIVTLTAAAATALRGAATLKARAMKEVLNIAAVLPAERGSTERSVGGARGSKAHHSHSYSGDFGPGDDFISACSQELLAKGTELLKRTRKGELHWKIVSVYINKTGQVMLKMKSKHVKGTITKKKKNVVLEVCKEMPAWPGRHLFDSGEQRRYFGLKTEARGVVEFECRNQREYDIWTLGVSRLLATVAEKKHKR